ncbi:hypothetical protein BT10792_00025 [Bacillus thuringiensis]|nr:hypothetical protein BT10792_00025 [Bacillus thuringiensis]
MLLDYEEHFQFGLEEGKTESEIIQGLGSPKVIAKELLAMYRFDEMKKIHRLQCDKSCYAAIGLSCLIYYCVRPVSRNCCFYIFFLDWWYASVVTPFSLLEKYLWYFIWLDLFVSITFVGVGLLLCIIAFYSTKWFKRLCVRYVI